MSVYGYVRVSTLRQVDEGDSLAAQQPFDFCVPLRAQAADHGFKPALALRNQLIYDHPGDEIVR